MGILTKGAPLSWHEYEQHIEKIKKIGLQQFITLYHLAKDRKDTDFKWGDEIEYTIVKFDKDNQKVRVSCRAEEILTKFLAEEEYNNYNGIKNDALWRPEFAAFQIENSPGAPYTDFLQCFQEVEENMAARRQSTSQHIRKDERIMSISFPSLGVPDFTYPPMKPTPKVSGPGQSIFISDETTYSHVRFMNHIRNIRTRRGDKLVINIPVYMDKMTPSPFVEDLSSLGGTEDIKRALPDHIFMDHMTFGVGCCCLQVTQLAKDLEEGKWLYDQLTPLSPIVLALSVATPIFRSILADVDSRWDVIAGACDDRNHEERGLKPLNISKWRLDKCRHGSTDCYLSTKATLYNDLPLHYYKEHLQQLLEGGVEENLAKHIAHLFIKDPIHVVEGRIEQGTVDDFEHFETALSSVWNNVRLKVPLPSQPEIGWRVEFRPTEVQLTDFENTAFTCFVVLVSRALLSLDLSLLIPISMVTENMKRAVKRDAVLTEKFYFVTDMTGTSEVVEELFIDEIINGKRNGFVGLIPLIYRFLETKDIDQPTLSIIQGYLQLISKRASGEVNTLARWMRNFVASHPAYNHDSRVSDEVIYDMITLMDNISSGSKHCDNLLGSKSSATSTEARFPNAA